MERIQRRPSTTLLPLSAGCLALTLGACDSGESEKAHRVSTAADNAWVSVSGTVVETHGRSFDLDYGDGRIRVEFDDWDWFPEAQRLVEEDDVVVYGYIDDDFYERRTIEASSVYVEDLGTHFYASGADEEDYYAPTTVVVEPIIVLSGTIESVGDRTFELSTQAGTVEVDTSALPYDPLDDQGFQQLQKGDRVRISGEIAPTLFDRELMAGSITVMEKAEKTAS